MTATAPRAGDDLGTASRILDAAEALVQVRGFNGFSYADIAKELRITKAALHYHFAGKADLGEALIARYTARFAQGLADIDAIGAAADVRLASYADLYQRVLSEERMCLCGILAAEYQTLSQPMREAVIGFFDHNENWLADLLRSGQQDGSLHVAGTPQGAARMIISGLEGAMLMARSYGDVTRFRTAADRLIAGLTARSVATADLGPAPMQPADA